MGEFKPTLEQQQALDATGTVLVSAAAGSGKTAVLSNRVVKMVTDPNNPVDINDLLIVTFTNAAAQEMRERISMLIDERVKADPKNKYLLRQKLSVDLAEIGTIDSFCINLVRENFVDAGVEPDFRIASKEQLKVLSDDAVRTAYERLAIRDYSAYSLLLTSLGCETVDDNAKKAVEKIYQYICSLPMPDRWLEMSAVAYDGCDSIDGSIWAKPMTDYVADTAQHYIAVLRRLLDIMDPQDPVSLNYAPQLEYYASEYLPALLKAARSGAYGNIYTVLRSKNPPEVSRKRNGDAQLKEMVKAVRDNLLDSLSNLEKLYMYPEDMVFNDIKAAAKIVKILVELVRDYRALLDKSKAERGIMSFADVELAALNLLCEDNDGKLTVKPSAEQLCNRYKLVMVDEYQDTNDLQNAIFNAMSGGGERLFLVGDVKQSIYRFRQANPCNFIAMRESFPDYDGERYPAKIALSGNFRSRPEICNFVNLCFDTLMTKKAAQIDYLKSDWLDPKASGLPENPDCGVEVQLLDGADVASQAQHVAAYIKQCVENGMQVADSGKLRAVRYSDFLVLCRYFSKYAGEFVAAMKNNGVPVTAALSTNFFECVEITMVMSILHAVDNPLKDIPLLSTMMSPIFGFTADEIAQMRAGNKRDGLYASLLEYAKTNQKANDFLSRLAKYRSWAATMSADRLICRIYDDTGITAIARSMEDGASKRANMLLLAEYAAAYEASGYKGLTSFLRYAQRVADNNNDITGASVGAGEDTVRIMSVHKSKGLQAPVCIVAGIEKRFNTVDSTASLVMHEQYGIGLKLCDTTDAVRYDTFARSAIAHAEHEALIAEELRLLYVAMTRAQEKLVIVSGESKLRKALDNASHMLLGDRADAYSVQGSAHSADWLYMCILNHPKVKELLSNKSVCGDVPDIAVNVYDVADIQADEVNTELEQKSIDLTDRLDYVYPYSGLLNIESKYSVSALAKSIYGNDDSCTSRPAFITGQSMTPAERGTATHRFMCYADYTAAKQDINAEAQRLVDAGKLTAEQADGMDKEAVAAFFESSVYKLICIADRVIRESRFILELPVNEIDPNCNYDETVVLQGVADCIIFEPDGITVVDFKTDRRTTEQALIEKYTKQLQLYARAFSANYQMPVKGCLLYSFSLKKAIETPLL